MDQEIVIILQGIIVVLVSACVKGIFGIKDQMSKLNGRLGKLETWSDDHEKLDDERGHAIAERLRQLREDLLILRKE